MKSITDIVKQTEFSDEDIIRLLSITDLQEAEILRKAAYDRATQVVGNDVYYRGLIEFSNICTLDCRYCGIRKSNHDVPRYELDKETIVEAALWAARNHYGSICLQSGERRDPKFIAFVTDVLKTIHEKTVSSDLPNGLGITLSLGEQTYEVYKQWALASGNPVGLRYLLRFETSNPKLFDHLHCAPGREKGLQRRFQALEDLKRAGYQVGSGVMIGIPGQTLEDLCQDIRTFQKLDLDMIGMGPYITSEGADMLNEGMMEEKALMRLSLNMIAVTRLVIPDINIAAATALHALEENGREKGILHGCNVIMLKHNTSHVSGLTVVQRAVTINTLGAVLKKNVTENVLDTAVLVHPNERNLSPVLVLECIMANDSTVGALHIIASNPTGKVITLNIIHFDDLPPHS